MVKLMDLYIDPFFFLAWSLVPFMKNFYSRRFDPVIFWDDNFHILTLGQILFFSWTPLIWCTVFGLMLINAMTHTLSNSCFLQVMYSQDKHSHPNVVETNDTSLELSLPINQDYVIQIKPFSEGGEGISSHQITIPKMEGGKVVTNKTGKYTRTSVYDTSAIGIYRTIGFAFQYSTSADIPVLFCFLRS